MEMEYQVHPKIKILNTFWEKNQINIQAFLISGELNALIDTGPRQGVKDTLALELLANNIMPKDICMILNTHGHSDHIGGNAALKALGRARIMIHEDDAIFLEDAQSCFKRFYAPFVEAMERNIEENRLVFSQEMGSSLVVDQRLKDNDRLDLGEGIEIKVIHLPGHTDGSVAYYWETEGILFIGDSVAGLGSPGGAFPIVIDLDAYEKSISRLLKMPISYILSSHPYRGVHLAPSIIRKKDEVRQFLYDSREFVFRLKDAISCQETELAGSLFKKTDKIIAAFPVEMDFKPLAEQRVPDFSLTTVFWAVRNQLDGKN
jgi:glyoxylase-like metal-dependent hydrolase (beta-lactamase superfamily II)